MVVQERLAVGGKHPETASLCNALARLDVRAPHSGEPFSEAMILGIGGGLGGGYWTFEFGGFPTLMLGFRHSWENAPRFLSAVCERLGVSVTIRETNGAKAAAKHLDEALAGDRGIVAWVDLAHLPYQALPIELQCYYYHLVGVLGLDPATGDVLVDDRAPVPWRVPRDVFETARGAIASAKRRLLLVEPPSRPIALPDAIRAGIRACYEGLTAPPIKNFGLPAFAKCADLIANPKDKKGWTRVFPPGPHLYRALGNTFWFIETAGTGGGALRPLYADFLDEAAPILAQPALHGVAGRYRALGRQWSDLATAALPASVPALRQARELVIRKNRLFEEHGAPASDEIRAVQAELKVLGEQIADAFPLGPDEIRALFAELSDRVRRIYDAECEAAEVLRLAVG